MHYEYLAHQKGTIYAIERNYRGEIVGAYGPLPLQDICCCGLPHLRYGAALALFVRQNLEAFQPYSCRIGSSETPCPLHL